MFSILSAFHFRNHFGRIFLLLLLGVVTLTLHAESEVLEVDEPTFVPEAQEFPPVLEAAVTQLREGNFKDAFEAIETLLFGAPNQDGQPELFQQSHAAAEAAALGIEALDDLDQEAKMDDFLSRIRQSYASDAEVLLKVASIYLDTLPSYGFRSAGVASRGNSRNQVDEYLNFSEHDRLIALQILDSQLEAMEQNLQSPLRSDYFQTFLRALKKNRTDTQNWKLQLKSDWSNPVDSYPKSDYSRQGLPIDPQTGEVLRYPLPQSFDSAKNDGERIRYLLESLRQSHPQEAEAEWCYFLYDQFSLNRLLYRDSAFPLTWQTDLESQLQGLSDQEFFVFLGNQFARITLPDDYNYLKIALRAAEAGDDTLKFFAAEELLNRHQFLRAETLLRELPNVSAAQDRLRELCAANGVLLDLRTMSSDRPAELSLRYRNASEIHVQLRKVDLDALFSRIKQDYGENAPNPDNQTSNSNDQKQKLPPLLFPDQLGNYLEQDQYREFLSEVFWTKSFPLAPRADHSAVETTLALDALPGGVYLAECELKEGLKLKQLIFVSDFSLVLRKEEAGLRIFAVDSATGAPLGKTELNLFSPYTTYREIAPEKPGIRVTRRAEQHAYDYTKQICDDNGIYFFDDENPCGESLLVIARYQDQWCWWGNWHWNRPWFYDSYVDQAQVEEKWRVLGISDRAIYQSGDTVDYTFYARKSNYANADGLGNIPESSATLSFQDPRGNQLWKKEVSFDRHGQISGKIDLDKNGHLGAYRLNLRLQEPNENASLSIRVEEFRKSELKVAVETPPAPIRYGEDFSVTIRAEYYFGAPAAGAKIRYQVQRDLAPQRQFYWGPWVWLYGDDYWICRSTCNVGAWLSFGNYAPSEAVLNGEATADAQGCVTISVPTAQTGTDFGTQDSIYTITAEAVDSSHYSASGSGKVRTDYEGFTAYVVPDRGFYRTGDEIELTLAAFRQNGENAISTLQCTYQLYGPETDWDAPRESWPVLEQGKLAITPESTDAPQLKLQAQAPGDYLCAITFDDESAKISKISDTLLRVRGSALANTSEVADTTATATVNFSRSDVLEIVCDKATYRPGDTAKILIVTDTANAPLYYTIQQHGKHPRVTRAANSGKAGLLLELPIDFDGMPNFHVEAFRVVHGNFYQSIKEIIVPPTEKIAVMELTPSAETAQRGDTVTLSLRLRDQAGNPIQGPVTLTVYDEALDALSPFPTPDLREFFWSWKRTLHPNYQTTLEWISNFFYDLKQQKLPQKERLLLFEELGFQLPDYLRNSVVAVPTPMMMSNDLVAEEQPALWVSEDAETETMYMGSFGSQKMNDSAATESIFAVPESAAAEPQILKLDTVRENFADSALFVAQALADENGMLELTLPLPDNLTRYQIKAFCITDSTTVGMAESSILVQKELLVRLALPTFLNANDRTNITVIAHNLTETEQTVTLQLYANTHERNEQSPRADFTIRDTVIAPHGETVLEQEFSATELTQGNVFCEASVQNRDGSRSDAMKLAIPVFPFQIPQLQADSAVISLSETQRNGTHTFQLNIPETTQADSRELAIKISPSIALSTLQSVPLLFEEETQNLFSIAGRLESALMAEKLLQTRNLSVAELQAIRNNLNATEWGEDASERAQWQEVQRFNNNTSPFDFSRLKELATRQLELLLNMQNQDGGFGWFSGNFEISYPDTTSQACRVLQLAQDCGYPVPIHRLEMLQDYLLCYMEQRWEELNAHPDQSIRALDVLVLEALSRIQNSHPEMLARAYRDRTKLSQNALALLGMTELRMGNQPERDMILKNLSQRLVRDELNQTAYLELTGDTPWWFWYGNENETQSNYLALLLAVNPASPDAPGLAKYLTVNLKNNLCKNSVRTLALAVSTLAEYAQISGESTAKSSCTLRFDGEELSRIVFTPETLFTQPTSFSIPAELLTPGAHQLEIVVESDRATNFFANTFLSYLTTHTTQIPEAGRELTVQRHYFVLEAVEDTVFQQNDEGVLVSYQSQQYRKIPLADGAELPSGTLVEVELELNARNDYEYVVVKDGKLAGCDIVENLSGYSYSNDAYYENALQEVRFYLHEVNRGKRALHYRIKTRTPGEFHALPARGNGLYAPELQCNSSAMTLVLEATPPEKATTFEKK